MATLREDRLSISPIGWINDDDKTLGANISLNQCLTEMKEAGFSLTELGSSFPENKESLKEVLDQFEMGVSSAWFSTFFTKGEFSKTVKSFLQFISRLEFVGTRTINLCECGFSYHQTDKPIFKDDNDLFSKEQWGQLIKGLHELGRIANDFGFSLSYHYHLGTGVQTTSHINRLMNHTCPDFLGLLLDTGHASANGLSNLELIQSFGERINQVHLKDIRKDVLEQAKKNQWSFLKSVREGLFTVPGDGDLDFPPIVSALNALNYQGFWVVEAEQDPMQANPLEYAKRARSEIKRWMEIENA